MKKIILTIAALICVISLAACGGGKAEPETVIVYVTEEPEEATTAEEAEATTEAAEIKETTAETEAEPTTKAPAQADTAEGIGENLITELTARYEALDEEKEQLLSATQNYNDYVSNSESITAFYQKMLDETNAMVIEAMTAGRDMANIILASDSGFRQKYEDADVIYDYIYEDARDIVYDIYDDIRGDLYDIYDDALDEPDDAPDYSTWSDAKSDAYELWSDSGSDIYEMWSDAGGDIYDFWSDFRSELFSEDSEGALKKIAKFEEKIEKLKK